MIVTRKPVFPRPYLSHKINRRVTTTRFSVAICSIATAIMGFQILLNVSG